LKTAKEAILKLHFWGTVVVALFVGALGQSLQLGRDQAMPEIKMQTLAGENVQLSSLRGQAVVLNFWASWCGPCRREIPVLERLKIKYPKVAFIGANVGETKRTINRFLSENPIGYTLWIDQPDGGTNLEAVLGDWQGAKQGWGIPYTVVVRPDGSIEDAIFGFDGTGVELELAIREVLK
jgi:thiol-disulfide isomerase/thioredoxin